MLNAYISTKENAISATSLNIIFVVFSDCFYVIDKQCLFKNFRKKQEIYIESKTIF